MKKTIKGLGETALRVRDLPTMQKFYEQVVGLELMRESASMAFFRIAEGYMGHTQILAMFVRSDVEDYQEPEIAKSTLDHFAFTIALEDYASEKARLEELGIKVETAVHNWVKWRSLFFHDPEGNHVEFVCYDGSITSEP